MLRLLGIIILLGSLSAFASKNTEVVVKLLAIKSIKSPEPGGDEIYLTVTEFTPNDRIISYTVPQRPLHWLPEY